MLYLLIIITAVILSLIFISVGRNKLNGHDVTSSASKTVAENNAVVMDGPLADALTQKISDVISDKRIIFDPKFSLKVLSDKVSSNKTYVSWIINNKYKKNFSTLLNEERIAEACRMLDDNAISSSYTIQSVYESLGYTTASSFIRQFKKIKGLTPSEYRNRKKSK